MLLSLRDGGRRDVLEAVAAGKLTLPQLYDEFARNRGRIDGILASAAIEPLTPLLEGWFKWLARPGSASPRTGRTYSQNTIRRYRQSWDVLMRHLPSEPTLADLGGTFARRFKDERSETGTVGPTINRDFNTMQSFVRWVREEQGFDVPELNMRKYRESRPLERWLTSEEVASLLKCTDQQWIPLFQLLLRTGLRIGEAQGLLWGDVQLASRLIRVRDNTLGNLKTDESVRDVPITEGLLPHLVAQARRMPSGPHDAVFPGRLGEYRTAYRAFKRAVKHAGLLPTRIHDLRHTFGVHCAIQRIPLSRIQYWMGHTTPAMTMRYLKHAEKAFLKEDARLIDQSLGQLYSPAPEVGEGEIRIIA